MDKMDIDDDLNTNGEKPTTVSIPSTSTKNRIRSSESKALRKKQKADFSDSSYPSSGLKTSLHGTIYQLQFLMLFAQQAVKQFSYFSLATEMKAAEKFDDVVIKYKQSNQDSTWKCKFLQAKHKLNPDESTIKVNDLITTKPKADFSLHKYFLSFSKIKNNSVFDDSELNEFILCTNTYFDFEKNLKDKKIATTWKSYFEVDTDVQNNTLLNFRNDLKFIKFKLTATAQPELSKLFKSTLLDEVLKSEEITKKPSISNFLKLIEYTGSKYAIEEKINDAKKILNDDNLKFNKMPLRRAMTKILKLKEVKPDILSIDKYEDLEVFLKFLKPNRNIKKKDYMYKLRFIDAKQKVKNIIDQLEEVLKKKKGQLKDYLNPEKQLFQFLHKEVNELLNLKKIITSYLEELKELLTIQEIATSIKKIGVVQYISTDTKKSLKNANTLVEDVKILVEKDFKKATTEIEALDLLMDNNKFKENLDDFINKFRLITKYPGVDELENYLKDELGQEFKQTNAILISHSFQIEILQWFRQYNKGRSVYLTEEKTKNFLIEIKKNLRNLLVSGLTKHYTDELRSYEIMFENLLDFNEKTQFLHIITNSTTLTSINILQTIESPSLPAHDSYIFLPMNIFLIPKTADLIFESFNSKNCHHCLVIEYQAKSKVDEQTLNSIFKQIDLILSSNNKKKLVLITENNEETNNMNYLRNYERMENNIDFNKLSSNSQQSLLDQCCNFQGKVKKLNEIINDKTAQLLFNKNTLNMIIEKNNINIGNSEAFSFNDYIEEYYIPRNLHRQKIKNEIFKKVNEQLFFVTGINDSQLQKLGILTNYIHKYSKLEKYYTGIIWCNECEDQNEIFQKLYTSANNGIHWLDYKGGNLYWKNFKSSNSQFSEIISFIDNDYVCNENYFHEDELNNIHEKIVIIANDAGVGKSTFLTSLAKKIQTKNDCTWIIRIDLNDFAFNKDNLHDKDKRRSMKSLKDITFSEDDNIESVIEYFTEMALGCTLKNNQIQQKLLKLSLSILDKEYLLPKIVILFDGFDEISPTFRNHTITLIKAIRKTNISQIYVTTRVHEKTVLENHLHTPALMLKLFDEEEQISFLIKYWQCNLKFFEIQDNSNLRTEMLKYLKEINFLPNDNEIKNLFIDQAKVLEIIQTINDGLSTDNDILRSYVDGLNFSQFAKNLLFEWKHYIIDNENAFNLVPLHLRMLAENVFYDKFEIKNNFNLLDLFDKFVKIKYDIYFKKQNSSDDMRHMVTEYLGEKFQKISLHVLFPDRYSEEINDEQKSQLVKTGLLVLKGTYHNFIHRSFTGYFLSEYAINHFASTDTQILLLQTVLLEREYQFIREFFNCQLERNTLDNIVISENAIKTVTIEFGSDTFLHNLSFEGYSRTLMFFIDKILKYPEILERLILITGRYRPLLNEIIDGTIRYHESVYFTTWGKSNSDSIHIILNKLKEHPDIVEKMLTNVFEEYTIIERMIYRKKIDLFKIVLNDVRENPQLLRNILMASKTGILNLIFWKNNLENFSSLLNYIYETVQHHLLILEEILLDTDRKGYTILHNLAHSKNTEFLENFLKWITIINENLNNNLIYKLVAKNEEKSGHKFTALEIAVYSENCNNVVLILNFLKKIFPETIFKDITVPNSKQNILFKSIIEGKTQTTRVLLDWLYKNISKSTMKDMLLTEAPKCGRNCLHLVCARGFHETLLVLLNFLKDINNDPDLYNILNCLLTTRSKNGGTALTEAVRWEKDDATETLLNFLSSNIDRECLNNLIDPSNHDYNIIKVLAYYGTTKSTQFLLLFILNNLGRDVLNNMIMSNYENITTPLHFAILRRDDENTCKVLLDFIHNNLGLESLKTILLKRDPYGNSPIHCATKECLEILKNKLNFIITKIQDSPNLFQFNQNELETLQDYMDLYEQNDKEYINTIIENIKSGIPITGINNDQSMSNNKEENSDTILETSDEDTTIQLVM